MTGFEHKCIHLKHDAAGDVTFTIELDFMGHGQFSPYTTVQTGPHGYACHVFPDGLSAHWVRVVADRDCTATVQLHYT